MFAALLPLLPLASAHIALWHPSMYGFKDGDWEANAASDPLPLGSSFNDWWFHNDLNDPPKEGRFMELPAGGVFHAEVSQFKTYTTWGKHADMKTTLAGSPYMLHAWDEADTPAEKTKKVMGSGIGIAYESDVSKIKPEDFVIISTNRRSPWYREVDFQIPAGLPACPPGGCHCMWGWIHNNGGKPEIYMNGYRCNVTGQTGTVPIPKPAIARKCPFDKNNCTVGAKQAHFWQVERGNNFQDTYDPPFYNDAYGFTDGAQNDLWTIDLGTTWSDKIAPLPTTEGQWVEGTGEHISRLPDAPVGQASGTVQVANSPDADLAPVAGGSPSSASTSPSASVSDASASPAASDASASAAASASASGSASAAASDAAPSASTDTPPVEPTATPVAEGGQPSLNGTLNVDHTGVNDTSAEAGGLNNTTPLDPAEPSANTTANSTEAANATSSGYGAASSGYGAASASAPASASSGASAPASASGGASAPASGTGGASTALIPTAPKKCKRSRRRSHRNRL